MTKNPKFGNFPPAPDGSHPLLDTEETSDQLPTGPSYRTFLASGQKADVVFNGRIYHAVDEFEGKHRYGEYLKCKSLAFFQVNIKTREVRVNAHSCGLRWCPFCIKSRRYVITNSVANWLANRERPRFITLTLRHRSAPLKEQIADLYYFFRQLRKTKLWQKKVKGGIWFFQVKRSKNGRYWHPHIHILTEGSYLPQADLRELWRKITHGSYIVDVREVKSHREAAKYVARYASAPCRLLDLPVDQAIECVQALHGQRICGTFGTAKGVALRPTANEDLEDWVTLDSFYNISIPNSSNEYANEIWEAWVNGREYQGDLPPPPDKIDEYYKKELDRPTTFNQAFFEFFN